MKLITKQGNNESKIEIWGYEHPDLATKMETAIETAGEQKVVGKTIRFNEPEDKIVKPMGTEVELVQTDLICRLETGETKYVSGPFPTLRKDLLPITNKIKSTCSIGGSRVVGVTRDTKAEKL